MATISERLRRLYPMPKDATMRGDLNEAADVIDVLAAELETAIEWLACVEPHLQDTSLFRCKLEGFRAALALARGEK